MSLNKIVTLFLVQIVSVAPSAFGDWQNIGVFPWKNIHLRSEGQKNLNIMGGEGFQQLMDIEYSPSNPSTVYMTTDTSQVWKSTNAGYTWKPMHEGLRGIGGLSLHIDKNDRNRLYLAGFTAKDTDASGIYVTDNGGETWTRMFSRAGYRKDWLVRGQDLFVQHNNDLFAATHNGNGLLMLQQGEGRWDPIEFDDESDIQNRDLGMILNIEQNPHSSELEIWISSYSGLFKLTESNSAHYRYHCEQITSANSGLPDLFTGWKRVGNPRGTTTLLDSSTMISDFSNSEEAPSALRIDFNTNAGGYWHTQWGQKITLTPGVEYTLTGKIMLDRVTDNQRGGVYLSAVDDYNNNNRWHTEFVKTDTVDEDGKRFWKNVTINFTPTYENTSATEGEPIRFKIVLQRNRNSAVSGSAWFDDIKLTTSDNPNENLLATGSSVDYTKFHGDTPTAIHFGSAPGEIIVSAGLHGLYRSIDGGESFEPYNNITSSLIGEKRINMDGSRYFPNVMMAGFNRAGGGNFISVDSGATWSEISNCNLDEDDRSLLNDIHSEDKVHTNYWATPTGFNPTDSNKMIHAFEGSLIFRSFPKSNNSTCNDNGVHEWHYSSDGYSGGRAGGGFAFGNDDNPRTSHFFLTDHGPYLTPDGGRSWKRLTLPDELPSNNASAGDVKDNHIVTSIGSWRGKYSQQIHISDNYGAEWSTDVNIQPTEDPAVFRYIAFDPVNAGVVYADNQVSQDYGLNWDPLPGFDGRVLTVIAISPTTGAIYAKDKDVDNVRDTTQIWRSIDQGENWDEVAVNALPARPKQLHHIAIAPENDYKIYAVIPNRGFYRLDEQDGRWEEHNSGITADIPDSPRGSYGTKYITIDPVHTNVIYIGKNNSSYGHSDGVFVSTDYGDTWENISKGLGQESTIFGLKVNPNNDAVYAATSLGTWAMSPLILNYHFDGKNNEFTVYNDSIHSITTEDSDLGDAHRGSGARLVTGGLAGNYLYLNGSSDAYVELPTYTTPLTEIDRYFTIEAMVRIDTEASLQNGPIIADKTQYAQPGGFLLRAWRGHISFAASSHDDSSLHSLARSETRLETDTWYHVAVTYLRGVVRLFINGEQEDTNYDNEIFDTTTLQSQRPLLIGASQISTANLNGAIDEVRIYNRVLRNQEIRNRYQYLFQR
jgi:photosystem II stability/assembly factor-like uncharacterized protein